MAVCRSTLGRSVFRLRSSSAGGVRRRDDSGPAAELAEPACGGVVATDDRAKQQVVVATEVLRGAVHDVVGAVLERAADRRGRGGRVDDDAAGMSGGRLEVGHCQERIRRRLEPDEVGAGRRRAGLVELDEPQAPALE